MNDVSTVWGFVVAGEPVGKGRPRISTRGGFARAYTPEPTRRFEARVREAAQAEMALRGLGPCLGLVRLVVTAEFTLPKSREKKRSPVPRQPKGGKPDADNVLKAVADALNGVAYADDGQVCEATVRKFSAAQGFVGRTVVELESVGGWWPSDARTPSLAGGAS